MKFNCLKFQFIILKRPKFMHVLEMYTMVITENCVYRVYNSFAGMHNKFKNASKLIQILCKHCTLIELLKHDILHEYIHCLFTELFTDQVYLSTW